MLEHSSNFLTLAGCWGLWWLWLYTWQRKIAVSQPETTNWWIDIRGYRSNMQRSQRNSRRVSTNSQTGFMADIERLIEWFTQAQKTKAEDEAMDEANDKIEIALEELRKSNEQLSAAIKKWADREH